MTHFLKTPGPWGVRFFDGDEWPEKRVSIGGGGHCVAISPRYGICDEYMPNYHMLAAAPELYEALQAAVDCGMVPNSSALGGGATAYSHQVRVADQIRAALAKAKGEGWGELK